MKDTVNIHVQKLNNKAKQTHSKTWVKHQFKNSLAAVNFSFSNQKQYFAWYQHLNLVLFKVQQVQSYLGTRAFQTQDDSPYLGM